MNMLKGTIVENSLKNTSVLSELNILKSWNDGSWKLHQVKVSREVAQSLPDYLDDGPWYVHFWEDNQEDVLVVFKDKTFDIIFSDKSTWFDAVSYGSSLGIPIEQLDFLIDQV